MRLLLTALLLPTIVGAQSVEPSTVNRPGVAVPDHIVLREGGPSAVATIVGNAIARPHALRAGHDELILRRDTLVTSNLLVLGRPTYLASRVQGDVVVVGADLYLRPGANISGRAISIGGTVTRTILGHVGGSVESYRDDDYVITSSPSGFELAYQGRRPDPAPVFELAGLQGIMTPAYDRVDGLSLPIGARVTLPESVVVLQPSLTYRSRLGVVDPGVTLAIMAGRPLRLEADVSRSTRTNDTWLYSDLVNSAATLAFGNDTRNYFRAEGGTARLIGRVASATTTFEPFVGGRYEKVSPITAAANVWSFSGRQSIEHMARPNPLVERGTIGSALFGARLQYSAGPVTANFSGEGERSTQTPVGTSAFTQLTLDGKIAFPTFGLQRLSVAGHGVISTGDSVPRSRYAYLGRGGSFPLLELLEQGGDRLLFIDSRYSIPVPGITLPLIGYPTLFLRHMIGAAGVGTLPKLEQEIGAGVGIKMFRADVTMDAARKRSASFGVGISLAD